MQKGISLTFFFFSRLFWLLKTETETDWRENGLEGRGTHGLWSCVTLEKARHLSEHSVATSRIDGASRSPVCNVSARCMMCSRCTVSISYGPAITSPLCLSQCPTPVTPV
jgi:hypothetical protein